MTVRGLSNADRTLWHEIASRADRMRLADLRKPDMEALVRLARTGVLTYRTLPDGSVRVRLSRMPAKARASA